MSKLGDEAAKDQKRPGFLNIIGRSLSILALSALIGATAAGFAVLAISMAAAPIIGAIAGAAALGYGGHELYSNTFGKGAEKQKNAIQSINNTFSSQKNTQKSSSDEDPDAPDKNTSSRAPRLQ